MRKHILLSIYITLSINYQTSKMNTLIEPILLTSSKKKNTQHLKGLPF